MAIEVGKGLYREPSNMSRNVVSYDGVAAQATLKFIPNYRSICGVKNATWYKL